MPEPELIRKILVASDGSEPSIHAAEYAAEIAKCMKAEVVILFVAEVTGVTQFMAYSVDPTENLDKEIRVAGEQIIADTKHPFLKADVPVRSKIIEGFAAEAIIDEAKAEKYDMIVMGSKGAGQGAIKKVFTGVGSVAERVIANAPCPVLVVRK